MTGPLDVCRCGHAARVHSVLESGDCRGCGCHTFTPAEDPDAATEAARSHLEHREATYKALRRAVASWRFGEARRLLDELQEADRG